MVESWQFLFCVDVRKIIRMKWFMISLTAFFYPSSNHHHLMLLLIMLLMMMTLYEHWNQQIKMIPNRSRIRNDDDDFLRLLHFKLSSPFEFFYFNSFYCNNMLYIATTTNSQHPLHLSSICHNIWLNYRYNR